MNGSEKCAHEVLASGPIARVELCARCDVVSVHLGPTTIRLEPGAVESLWATLGEALGAMKRGSTRESGSAALALHPFRGVA